MQIDKQVKFVLLFSIVFVGICFVMVDEHGLLLLYTFYSASKLLVIDKNTLDVKDVLVQLYEI